MNILRSLAAKISKRYKNMSIQVIISLSFTLVAVVGTVCMGLSLFWRFAADTRRIEQENSQRVLSQVNLNLDSYLRRIMRISDTMYYRVIKDTDLQSESLEDSMRLLYEENKDSLVSISLFNSSGQLVSAVPYNTLKDNLEPTKEKFFTLASSRIENLHFFTPHVQNLLEDNEYAYRWVVSLSRYVQLTYGGESHQGVLLVDMNYTGIEQICRNLDLSNEGYVYLIDGAGELIYHPKQQLVYAGLFSENNLAAANYRDGTLQETFNNQTRQITVKTVGYTGWKLVGVVPTGSFIFNSYRFILFAVSLIIFFTFLMAFLNFRISAHISDPIRKLERAIKKIETGAKDATFPNDGCYEVTRLAHSIQSMVSTMRHLMLDVIQQEGEKRRTELEVLQSQINPHFLYNSLDSVVWMVESGRNDEAIQMVTSLARLFRISLSKGSSIITLADEIQHASHYMIIQKIRYKNKFETKINISDSVNGLYSLKLCIQPVLENAILHGMAAVDDGLIEVNVYRESDDLIIDVVDNGAGMSKEIAARLLDKNAISEVSSKGSGVGAKNVDSRLRLTFGSEYGLTVFSEPDVGTTVRIRQPAITEQTVGFWKGEHK